MVFRLRAGGVAAGDDLECERLLLLLLVVGLVVSLFGIFFSSTDLIGRPRLLGI